MVGEGLIRQGATIATRYYGENRDQAVLAVSRFLNFSRVRIKPALCHRRTIPVLGRSRMETLVPSEGRAVAWYRALSMEWSVATFSSRACRTLSRTRNRANLAYLLVLACVMVYI
jgi:hypothetical protein